jgi:hypothetical protein
MVTKFIPKVSFQGDNSTQHGGQMIGTVAPWSQYRCLQFGIEEEITITELGIVSLKANTFWNPQKFNDDHTLQK